MTIANAQLEMHKGEVERALTMLRAIQTSSAHYNAARRVMAELYLNYRNDERAYAQCHEELVRANPTTRLPEVPTRTSVTATQPPARSRSCSAYTHAHRRSISAPLRVDKMTDLSFRLRPCSMLGRSDAGPSSRLSGPSTRSAGGQHGL